MPKYTSKTQSKNSRRYKKQTKRKLRRGRKSRKVMRGGGEYSNEQLAKAMSSMEYPDQLLVGEYLNSILKNQTKTPYAWSQDMKNNTIKQQLDQDPTLNEKINSNQDLMKLLKYPLLDLLSPQKSVSSASGLSVRDWDGSIIKM